MIDFDGGSLHPACGTTSLITAIPGASSARNCSSFWSSSALWPSLIQRV